MKNEKRFCIVARNHPLEEFAAIEDDLLAMEEECDQRSLLRKMDRVRRAKSYLQYLLFGVWIMFGQGLINADEVAAQQSGNPFAAPYSQLDPKCFNSHILHNRSPYYNSSFFLDTATLMFVPDTTYTAAPYLYSGGEIMMQSHTFLKLYRDLLFSQIHDSVIINPEDYYDNLQDAEDLYQVPISLMAVIFHRMNEDAVISGKIFYDSASGMFCPMPDTLWLPDSIVLPDTVVYSYGNNYLLFPNPDSLICLAFDEHWAFGSRIPDEPLFVSSNIFTLNYGLPSGLFVSNIDSLPGVLIDFDDGAGFRSVSWDTPTDINYHRPENPKNQELNIRIKIPGLNSDMVLKHSLLVVTNAIIPDTIINVDDLPFVCVPDVASTPGTARASIIFADQNFGKLQKPILFVEGFETSLKDYGDISFMNVVNGAMPHLGYPEIEEMPLLFETLVGLGYDLVYLDFKNPRDTLDRNMLSVIKTIQWINDQLVCNNSEEKLVVAGASMGGLLARYALRKMELDGCCHNTRLYISFDAPHQGANIPMGVQKLVEVASKNSKEWKDMQWPMTWILKFLDLAIDLNNPDIEETWKLVLNSPAARTMLMQHVDSLAGIMHNDFYYMLDSIGYPQSCRRISLINGSETSDFHLLEDQYSRLLGTGRTESLPYEWMIAPLGLNCLFLPYHYPIVPADYSVAYSTAWAESETNYFAHNDWNLTIHNMNEILRKSLAGTALNTTLGLLAVASGLQNPLLALFFESAIVTNKKIGNSTLKAIHDLSYNDQLYASTGLQDLTCAPGGLNNSIKKLGSAADGQVKVYSSHFSFVPSVSALDVKNVPLNIPLRYMCLNVVTGFTPFDSYWAPARKEYGDSASNQLHVQVTQINREWIVDHIESDWQLRSPSGKYEAVLSSVYNYARPGSIPDIEYFNLPHQSILYSLDIDNGGVLAVNRQAEIGLQGSGMMPKPAGLFRLAASGDVCDPAYVRVLDGGQLVLGDHYNLNKAEVFFNPGSTLELFDGSTLTVNNNSKLTIGIGATLIIHPGAQIELDGKNSMIEIQGNIVLMDSTILTTSGSGFFRFNAPMKASDYHGYITAGANTAIFLEGDGQTHKKLEIASDTWFPDNLDVSLLNSKVEIEENVNLHIFGSVIFDNIWFCSKDTTQFYGSVAVYGNKNTIIQNCRFSHASTGLKANLGLGGYPLLVSESVFRKNIVGLNTVDERASLVSCLFAENYNIGWLAENMAGQSLADNSVFSYNGHAGIFFDGQLSSSLLIRNTEITDNIFGVELNHALLQAECSEFSNNAYAGIKGGYMSRINLGGMMKNQIVDNYIGIVLDRALNINLENGHARFSGNQYYIIGELLPNQYYNPLSNSVNSVDLSGNHMPIPGNVLPVNIYITHPISNITTQVGVLVNTMVSTQQTVCANLASAEHHISVPLHMLSGVSVIQGGKYNNYFLLDALIDAAMNVSYDGFQGDDTLAIASFSEIMSRLPLLMNEDEIAGLDYALQLMTNAISNAIETGAIDPNRAVDGVPVDQYVEILAQVINDRIDAIDSYDMFAEETEARYALMLAQMYRVAEHYDYALDILNGRGHFNNTDLANSAYYWECVCNAERLLLQDSIGKSDFASMMDSCSFVLNARMKPFLPQFGSTVMDNQGNENSHIKRVYPNPAYRAVLIEFNVSVDHLELELLDITGRKIWSHKDARCGTQTKIALPPDIAPGSYALKIKTNDVTSMHKLVIRKN